MKNKIANYAFGIVALLIVIAGSVGFAVHESHSEKPTTMSAAQVLVDDTNPTAIPTSVDLTGVWVQGDGTQQENMTAQISHGRIEIVLQLGNRTATYWEGSFDYDQVQPGVTSFDVISQSNHPVSLFASKLDNKTFSYKDGVLSYDFKIVGTDHTIKLEKGGA